MTTDYTSNPVRIGVLGGTGLYRIDGLKNLREVQITTPFGDPSDNITIGSLNGTEVAFLPRHGRGHRILPSEVPAQANVYALKVLGVERLISVSAVGSLKQAITPLDMVVPDQIIDRTRLRPSSFFGNGLVAHVAYGDPFCSELRDQLANAADETKATIHRGGTYLVMEGPAFSTRAESKLYQSWGASIIGMTASPEAKLAREAEMCFAVLATATDYDAWHDSHDDVTVEMVLTNLTKNAAASQAVLRKLIPRLTKERHCNCTAALATALVTAKEWVPKETLDRLRPLVAKYMS